MCQCMHICKYYCIDVTVNGLITSFIDIFDYHAFSTYVY